MNEFIGWSNAQATQQGTGDKEFDDLEKRIRVAKEANKAYKQELTMKNNTARKNKKTEISEVYSGGDMDQNFHSPSKGSVGGSGDEKQLDKFISEFRMLTRDMTDFLEKNKLNTIQTTSDDPLSATNEAKRKEENIRRKEIKDKINSLLLQYDKSNDRIPMWRHRMRGNFMPRPDQVLKGKALLRGIALAIWVFYAKPKVAVLVKKRNKKDAEEDNFAKTLLLFRDTCNSWMAKLNRLPIQSIQQVDTIHECI